VLTAEVYEESTVRSQIIDQLGQGTTVDFIESSGDWSLVHIDGPPEKGWIRSRELSETPVEYLTIGERLRRSAENRKQSRKRMTEQRRRNFVERHPGLSPRIEEALLQGRVLVGMTSTMVEASWGEATDINRTITADQTREQWIYGSAGDRTYLYFDDGVLTTVQE